MGFFEAIVFILLPFVWLIGWLVIGGVVAAFSGLAPKGGGVVLLLAIFLGGGFGLPVLAGIGWWIVHRFRQGR